MFTKTIFNVFKKKKIKPNKLKEMQGNVFE